jgi:hypothetical protein
MIGLKTIQQRPAGVNIKNKVKKITQIKNHQFGMTKCGECSTDMIRILKLNQKKIPCPDTWLK